MIMPNLTASRDKSPGELLLGVGGGREKSSGDKKGSFAPLLYGFENKPGEEVSGSIEPDRSGQIAPSIKNNYSALLEELIGGLPEEGLLSKEDELLSFDELEKRPSSGEYKGEEESRPSAPESGRNFSAPVETILPLGTPGDLPARNEGGQGVEALVELTAPKPEFFPQQEAERAEEEPGTQDNSLLESRVGDDGAAGLEEDEKRGFSLPESTCLSRDRLPLGAAGPEKTGDTAGMSDEKEIVPAGEEGIIGGQEPLETTADKAPLPHGPAVGLSSPERQGAPAEDEEESRATVQPGGKESPLSTAGKIDAKVEDHGKNKREDTSSSTDREQPSPASHVHKTYRDMESPSLQREAPGPDFSRALALAGRGSSAMEDGIHNVVRFMRSEGRHKASMIVDPPALGRVEIELASSTKGLEASIRVANEQLRLVVQDQIAQLRVHLQQLGVQTAEFTVDIHDHGGESDRNRGGEAKRPKARGLDGDDDFDDDALTFRVDLEQGLLHWVA